MEREERRRPLVPVLGAAVAIGILAVVAVIVLLARDDGTSTTRVPSVVGRTEAAATASLRNAGFRVSLVRAADNLVPAGVVVEQSPTGGRKVDHHSVVAITVSSGPLLPAPAPPPPVVVTPTAPSTSTTTSTTTTSTTTTTSPPST